MKKLTQEEINKKLERHKHWIEEDCDGWEEMKADFYDCDLRSANLRYADLRYADLSYANLSYADLSSANLSSADLSYANLSYANLRYADLSSADLSYADLSYANLSSANLRYADLSSADLSYANLSYANLSSANLRYADLSYANLSYADLSSANLSSAKEVPYIPMVCPEEGEFIGWKKAHNVIIKLFVPGDAKRSSATSRKCRCNKAKVLEIYNINGTIADKKEVASDRDPDFIYKVGETVEVKDFDGNRWDECTKGIHFFINRQEAIKYN